MKIVFASNNAGKIAELQALLDKFQITLIPQSQLSIPEIEETAVTFVENALLKARHAAALTGLPAIADDSGLEVFALQGKPGIHSARYAGKKANSEDNIEKLLKELAAIPDEKRRARFYCTLTYLSQPNDPTPLICQGSWYGTILKKPQGTNGFGYDPIFYVPSEKCSAAELPVDKKNLLSHRGQAVKILMEKIMEKIYYDQSTQY
jgi:XTP/dITP diphosphohydrolase